MIAVVYQFVIAVVQRVAVYQDATAPFRYLVIQRWLDKLDENKNEENRENKREYCDDVN